MFRSWRQRPTATMPPPRRRRLKTKTRGTKATDHKGPGRTEKLRKPIPVIGFAFHFSQCPAFSLPQLSPPQPWLFPIFPFLPPLHSVHYGETEQPANQRPPAPSPGPLRPPLG